MAIATECPDCGSGFYGYKCGCGYKMPYNRMEAPIAQQTTCLAHGCPLPGSVSESTRPPHNWLCRFHFGEPAQSWQEITRKVRAMSAEDQAKRVFL